MHSPEKRQKKNKNKRKEKKDFKKNRPRWTFLKPYKIKIIWHFYADFMSFCKRPWTLSHKEVVKPSFKLDLHSRLATPPQYTQKGLIRNFAASKQSRVTIWSYSSQPQCSHWKHSPQQLLFWISRDEEKKKSHNYTNYKWNKMLHISWVTVGLLLWNH